MFRSEPSWTRSRERIEKLFAEEVGKHFDPDLTKILLAHMDEIERVRDAFSEQIPNTK